MKGFGDQTKSKKKLNNFRIKQYHKQIMNEAVKLHSAGNFSEAKKYYHKLIQEGVEDPNVFNNYGIVLVNVGELKEAELSIRKAIELNPKDPGSYTNLGGILLNVGKLKEAELSIRKAIELNPNSADANYILGNVLKNLGNLKEAEVTIRKVIELNPQSANAHYTLGNILKDLENLEEAELFIRKAIQLYPDFGNAYLCLGIILRDLGKLDEAELSTRKSMLLNCTDLALCYRNLSLLLFAKGKIKIALENIENAVSIDSKSKVNRLLISILRNRNNAKLNKRSTHVYTLTNNAQFSSYPIILNKAVDLELINSLYKIKALDLNKLTDPSWGNARGSDYQLFEDNEIITNKLEKDLITITKKIVDSNVFFRDSFFTILSGNSTIMKHNHIGNIDKFSDLNLWKQKYSLVYYLSIGDQDCKHPGILKFYKDENDNNSYKEILPSEGMILIFPADTYHSAKYDGNKDRIIIGVNFYSI